MMCSALKKAMLGFKLLLCVIYILPNTLIADESTQALDDPSSIVAQATAEAQEIIKQDPPQVVEDDYEENVVESEDPKISETATEVVESGNDTSSDGQGISPHEEISDVQEPELGIAHEETSSADDQSQDEAQVADDQEQDDEDLEDATDVDEEVSAQDVDDQEDEDDDAIVPRSIKAIIIHGNQNVTNEAILSKIPYHIGEVFSPIKTGILIRNVYDLGFFKNVKVFGQNIGKDEVNLHVVVDEKKLLKEFKFEGNKHLTPKEIEKKGIALPDVQAVDEHDVQALIKKFKKIYREKDYHNASIEGELREEDGKATVVFNIDEKKKSVVKRVFFKGNKAFDEKLLRNKIFTREDWVLSFMDRAGSYQPEAIEADKHAIEDFYQSAGFLTAKVPNVEIEHVEGTNYVNVTFNIQEGDQFTLSEISVPGNDIMPEEQLLALLPIRVGQLYSKELIRKTIERLREIWGEHGYIYADIEPSIEPDDATKTVKLAFFTELGDKVYLNRINIRGNEKTRDKIIRRNLLFEEGDLLTTKKMDSSKERIESLGYFEQKDGVSWKINRKDKEMVDVDVYVREIKTGRVDAQIGFGGSPKDIQNPTQSMRIGASISDTNLLGLGVGFNLNTEFSKQERQLQLNLTQPYLFDKPIYGAFDMSFKRSNYEEFKFTTDEIKEKLATGSFSLGYLAENMGCTKFVTQGGIEGIHYTSRPEVNTSQITDAKEQQEFRQILKNRFMEGNFPWIGIQSSQDHRNHPTMPSRGHQWLFQSKTGVPNADFGFQKFDFDFSYYTPIIGEYDLIFYFHSHFGVVVPFGKNTIPFRELYHIGGPATVRGFLFGQIGPQYKNVDSIGATKAFWFNSELIFPITSDMSIKGIVFYDGGAGWSTPGADQISPRRLFNNDFSYRHAVGIGVKLLRPTPIKVYWGFKLDKRRGEKESEVHLQMAHDF